jgi:hypothetical protein
MLSILVPTGKATKVRGSSAKEQTLPVLRRSCLQDSLLQPACDILKQKTLGLVNGRWNILFGHICMAEHVANLRSSILGASHNSFTKVLSPDW